MAHSLDYYKVAAVATACAHLDYTPTTDPQVLHWINSGYGRLTSRALTSSTFSVQCRIRLYNDVLSRATMAGISAANQATLQDIATTTRAGLPEADAALKLFEQWYVLTSAVGGND